MITLSFILYVVFSLLISLDNMRDRRVWHGIEKGMDIKEAFINGFAFIPIVLLIMLFILLAMGVVLGLAFLAIEAGLWIVTHLP